MIKNFLIFAFIAFSAWWWFTQDMTPIQQDGEVVKFYYTEKNHSDASRRPVPMIIALHGNGDTRNGFYKSLLKDFKGRFRIVLVKGTEPYPQGKFWTSAWPMEPTRIRTVGNAFANLIPKLTEKFPTQGKPILIGFSGGAVMSYYLASNHPSLFSAILPISGALPTNLFSKKRRFNSPASIYAFHGSEDKVIPFKSGQATVRQLKRQGLKVNFKRFIGGHLGLFDSQKAQVLQITKDLSREIGK